VSGARRPQTRARSGAETACAPISCDPADLAGGMSIAYIRAEFFDADFRPIRFNKSLFVEQL
jgi:hypothetical protein